MRKEICAQKSPPERGEPFASIGHKGHILMPTRKSFRSLYSP